MTTNLLEEWKKLQQKRITEIDKNTAFPLLRWSSGNPNNLPACTMINELFFKVDAKIIISLLAANCNVNGYVQYPKKNKQTSNEREELIKEYICKIYDWSQREYEKNKSVLNEDDCVRLIQERCGLNKKECKILGVEYGTIKKYKFTADKPRSNLSSFM